MLRRYRTVLSGVKSWGEGYIVGEKSNPKSRDNVRFHLEMETWPRGAEIKVSSMRWHSDGSQQSSQWACVSFTEGPRVDHGVIVP